MLGRSGGMGGCGACMWRRSVSCVGYVLITWSMAAAVCGGSSCVSRLWVTDLRSGVFSSTMCRSWLFGTLRTRSQLTRNRPRQRCASTQTALRLVRSTPESICATPQNWPLPFTEKKR